MVIPVNQNNLADDCVIADVLYVLRDKKMYINEKKMLISAIDILDHKGYYRSRTNNNEKASLFGELR